MTSLLMQSDLILRSFSHQSAMISVLAEHSSLLGLKVKVLYPFDFPSGFIYHRKKGKGPYGNFFVDQQEGKVDPYIFHMSWTKNKDNKLKFFQQMGEWYVNEQCVHKKVGEVAGVDSSASDGFAQACCAAEPIIKCHYRDKASKFPCKDSPNIDEGKRSFW